VYEGKPEEWLDEKDYALSPDEEIALVEGMEQALAFWEDEMPPAEAGPSEDGGEGGDSWCDTRGLPVAPHIAIAEAISLTRAEWGTIMGLVSNNAGQMRHALHHGQPSQTAAMKFQVAIEEHDEILRKIRAFLEWQYGDAACERELESYV
jgi:hypothetical protein